MLIELTDVYRKQAVLINQKTLNCIHITKSQYYTNFLTQIPQMLQMKSM